MACIDCGEEVTPLDELGYCDACNASWEEYEEAKDGWEQSYYNGDLELE